MRYIKEKQNDIEVTPVTFIPDSQPHSQTTTQHNTITQTLQDITLPIIEYTQTKNVDNQITIHNVNNKFKTRFFAPEKLDLTTKQLTTPFTLTFNTNTATNTVQALCELLGNVTQTTQNNEFKSSDITQNKLRLERTEQTGQKTYICHHLTPTQHTELCIFENITNEVNKTQFVKVLQRLFRHNLRNDLNVIKGHSQKILDQATDTTHPGITDSAQTIHNKTNKLIKLGAETQLIQDVINNEKPLTERNLHSSIKTVINDKQTTHPQATFNTELKTNGRIAGTTHIEDLVDALISNAITHNTHPITVTVKVLDSNTPNHRQLRVTDNGPGIPQNEKDIILGNADITSLNHASGLGLWVVRWIADEHGANITFNNTNKNTPGTTVTIEFQTPNALTNTPQQ